MNRRGHQSVKIPNVKLRPAPAPTAESSRKRARQRQSSPLNALDDELRRRVLEEAEAEESSHAALGSSSKPWAGIVITFTGAENKPRLTELVRELGGEVEHALTVDVTHIIAVGFGSPKYLYAVEHRLPVMMPSWILDAHARWLGGEELDVKADMEKHRLLPFFGLRIAISGIEPLERRKQLVSYITQYGGIYSKDLDRTCTHLVSAKSALDSKSSEKVKWALKEIQDRDIARRRGKKLVDDDIRIIYEEWIWDCVGFAGRWKEDSYDARKPRRRGKVSAEDVFSGKAFIEPEAEKKPAEEAEVHQPAAVRKRKREHMDLVGEIISTAVKKEPEEPSREPTAGLDDVPGPSKDNQQVQATDKGARRPTEVEQKPSILHTSRQTSFTAGPSAVSAKAGGEVKPRDMPNHDHDVSAAALEPPQQFFAGLRFTHNISQDCEGLERAIALHGGQLVIGTSEDAKIDFFIIRLYSQTVPELPILEKTARVVTECWVEGCCFEQKLLSPDDHLVFQPLPAPMPIPGAGKLLVHLSGFSTADTVYLRRLLRAIGGELSVKLNRQSTHLVCAQPTGQKYEKAHEWGVSVVKDTWLFGMGRSGVLEPESAHRHDGPPPPINRTVAKLTNKTNSISGMSMISDLNDAMDYSRVNPESTVSQSGNIPLSQSRLLKLTPTHIDDEISISVQHVTGSTSTVVLPPPPPPGISSCAHPLSPPKTETMRRLNQAAPFHPPSLPDIKPSPSLSADPHILRTTSAPPLSDSLSRRSNPFSKAISTSGRIERTTTTTATNQSTTEMLRLLAQREDDSSVSRNKVIRRSRLSGASASASKSRSRLRSTDTTSASPGTPVPASEEQVQEQEQDKERQLEIQSGGQDTEIQVDVEAEESMRVMYVDHEAARTKRKLMEAVMRGSRGEISSSTTTTGNKTRR
ncbi:hypothetical protein BCR39DRAFT_523376 [Naematelia encephala]|uniref:BRCT domain-containing protein n=1 Tax=Naematelia encephala TaxID=71784 RepID=A0A1Y2BBL4_9TREE|nr:hypothetical protein BCR39DRAFT_523376 [Naematelia encephala]